MSVVRNEPYQPISCDFYDILEAMATTRRQADIQFRDGEGAPQHRSACINDLFAHEGVEYVLLNNGESIRLDRLISVDHARLIDFA